MSKGVLVAAGLVVVAGIVVLVFLLGGSDSAASRGQGSGVVVTSHVGGGGEGGGRGGGGGTTEAPSLPETGVAVPAGDAEHPREYVVGNMRIRDHRSGEPAAPVDVPPPVHPAEGHQIPSTLTHEIAQKVKAVMQQCAADVPKDARGPKPRLEGQILITIKDQKLTITKSVMQLRDMFGDTIDAMKQCIEQKTVGLDNAAIDQPDLADYTINVSFAIL